MTSPVDATPGDPPDGAGGAVGLPLADDARSPTPAGDVDVSEPPTVPEDPEAPDASTDAAFERQGDGRDGRNGAGVDGADALGARARTRASAPEIAAAICPYLSSAGGSWRMAVPSRDHRCLGLTPPSPQPTEKQRRHCLVAEHVECSIYRAAREARSTALAGAVDPARIAVADARRRAVPRTAPVLLEPPRLLDQASRLQFDRTPGQLALVGLMVIAFVFVAVSRLSAGALGPADAASASPSMIAIRPSVSAAPTSSARVPSASKTAVPSGSPSASFRTTYTVKKGDTLAAIAAKFKTTAAAIQTLNSLKNVPLHVGQVLKIP